MSNRIDSWLAAACTDADRRGLSELIPLLEALAKSTASLRAIDERQRLRAEPATARDPRSS